MSQSLAVIEKNFYELELTKNFHLNHMYNLSVRKTVKSEYTVTDCFFVKVQAAKLIIKRFYQSTVLICNGCLFHLEG